MYQGSNENAGLNDIFCLVTANNGCDNGSVIVVEMLEGAEISLNAPAICENEPFYIETTTNGNITWNEQPAWDSGSKNEFTWVVDRANPKKLLPMSFKGSAYLENEKLRLDIELSGEPYLSVTAENMSYK